MQLSEMRYITGIVTQGAGKIAGYSLAEPTDDIKKPDIVMTNDVAAYLKNNNCKIINANIDAAGQVTFKSKADQESYVTLNSSGYVLGWPKKPLSKLHEGNKTGGKTGEMLRPTHSYIVIDVDKNNDTVKVMNIGGMIKPMSIQKLVSAVQSGLIISNAEIKNNEICLLSKGLSELTQHVTNATAQLQPNNTPQVVPLRPPVAPLRPPVTQPLQATTPIQTSTPAVTPAVTPVVTPAVTPVEVSQTTSFNVQAQPTTTVRTTRSSMDLVDILNNYSTLDTFVNDYTGKAVEIRFDLYSVAPEQFNCVSTDIDKNALIYNVKQAVDDFDYDITAASKRYLEFLNLLNNPDIRKALSGITLDLHYKDKPVHMLDYHMLYIEKGFLNFGYLINWNKVDLYHNESIRTYKCAYFSPNISLLLLPNKLLSFTSTRVEDSETGEDIIDETEKNGALTKVKKVKRTYFVSDINTLCGTFSAQDTDVWYDLTIRGLLSKNERKEDLRIVLHPKARISETTEGSLDIFIDYPFGQFGELPKLIVDLSKSTLRFIASDAIRIQTGANYELILPSTCKRLHDNCIKVQTIHETGLVHTLLSGKPTNMYINYTRGYDSSSFNYGSTVTIFGTAVERIDDVGRAFASQMNISNRLFIKMADWSSILNLSSTSITFEDLPKISRAIDVTPYLEKQTSIINEWYGIGTWSDIGKGKIKALINSKPNEINEHINVLIDGTVAKADLRLVSEYSDTYHRWPRIDYLFVEEGVTELTITACTPIYKRNKQQFIGYVGNYINHLILPASLKRISLQITTHLHNNFVRNVHVADNSIMARFDLKKQFERLLLFNDVHKYPAEATFHEKNILSDLIGSDLSNLAIVSFGVDSIKANLAHCGIIL